jgi:RNA polymerase sigma factor (sigma-70 family)
LDNTLRIESRFKNARLYDAIKERSIALSAHASGRGVQSFGPIKPWCNLVGISYPAVYDLLNLKVGPFRGRKVRPIAQKLADLLDTSVAWLFPEELYAHKWPSVVTRNVSPTMLGLAAARGVLSGDVGPEDAMLGVETREAVLKALQTLSPRESQVITLRFGFNANEGEHTLDETANRLCVSRERVRQIEMKALRKLRHPMRAKALRPFTPLESIPTGWA